MLAAKKVSKTRLNECNAKFINVYKCLNNTLYTITSNPQSRSKLDHDIWWRICAWLRCNNYLKTLSVFEQYTLHNYIKSPVAV